MHVRPDRVQLLQHPVVERRSINVSERAILRSACAIGRRPERGMMGQPFVAVVALVLAGARCMVGPNYPRPDVVTPHLNPDGVGSRAASQYAEGENLVDMIKEDLVAERVAIETYREMVRYFGDRD